MGYLSNYTISIPETGHSFKGPDHVTAYDILMDFKLYIENDWVFFFPIFTSRMTVAPELRSSDMYTWYDHIKDVQKFMDDSSVLVTEGTILCVERHGEEQGDSERIYFKRGVPEQHYKARLEYDDDHVVADFQFQRESD